MYPSAVMSIPSNKQLWIGTSEQLADGTFLRIAVTYAGEPASVIVFRHKGQCLAFRNRCVHMPRELDGEKNTIFDETGKHLRCSMHGIVYDPLSGESLSTMCNGERLTPVRILENDEGIWLNDKRVKPLTLEE